MEFHVQGGVVNVEDIIEIASHAARVIEDIYFSDIANWNAKFKEDESPLTQAQGAAFNIIETELKIKYPNIPILAEAINLETVDRSGNTVFCVSPLDGYKDFVRRNGQFSVSIGLCDNHEPVLGVIYVPCSTIGPPRVYYAVEGGGAYVRNLESSLVPSDSGSEADSTAPQPKHKLSIITPTRLEADAFYESDKNLRILAHTPSFGAESMKAFLGSYSSPDISTGAGGGFSLLNLMSIAEGKAHILPRLASSCEWNTCAAHAIINEAGGEILQVAGGAVACTGAQLEYNKPHPLNPHFIAYGKRLILSPAASPSMSQMRGISTHMTPTLLDTVADRRSESFRSLREDVIDESDDDLEELSEGSEQRSEDGVLKNPRRLFQSVVDPHGRSHFKSSPSHRGSVNDGGAAIAQLQTEHSEDHEVRKEINGVHTVKKGNDGGHQDSENGPERIGSSLYGNMLFTFLVASFVVLLGWVLLPSPVNLE